MVKTISVKKKNLFKYSTRNNKTFSVNVNILTFKTTQHKKKLLPIRNYTNYHYTVMAHSPTCLELSI